MAKPKIDRLIDWRAVREKVNGEEYKRERDKALTTIKSFRDMRKLLGLTQLDVAEILKMTQSNVSKIESRELPSLEVLSSVVKGKGRVRVLVELDEGQTIEFQVND
jgi:transcriptional regulator